MLAPQVPIVESLNACWQQTCHLCNCAGKLLPLSEVTVLSRLVSGTDRMMWFTIASAIALCNAQPYSGANVPVALALPTASGAVAEELIMFTGGDG